MAATKKNNTGSRALHGDGTQKKNKSPAKKSSPTKGKNAKRKPEPEGIFGLSRESWAAVYGVCGLLSLITILKRDGAVLRMLYTTLGGMVGWGIYVTPFALFGITALLLTRRKGPVRLRGAAIACIPILFGAFVHALWCGPSYTDTGLTMFRLLGDGAKMQAGGLLGGGFYSILRWAFSGIGAMILIVVAILADIMVICRLTPEAVWDALRPLEYEYDSDEEREFYEGPVVLPNVHEAVANRRAQRAEKRASFDVALDDEPQTALDTPAIPELVMQAVPNEEPEPHEPDEPVDDSPLEDVLALFEKHEKVMEDPYTAIETPVMEEDTPPWEEKTEPSAPAQNKPEKISQDEQAAMNAQMDENQKAPLPIYEHPPIDLLSQAKGGTKGNVQAELTENSERLVDTLESFGIDAKIIGIVRGPSVTRFELTIERGVKFSRITALSDDIALSLGAVSVRIAPIPDKMAIGIEVPNKTTTMVKIREVLGSEAFAHAKSQVAFAVGKDITGAPVVGNIAKMPHLLIAGTTGSGKSVCVNSMLISLLYKSSPEEVRLIMVDPKMVELGNYNGIPHLLIPVVTDPKKAAGALNWAVGEMERRYKLFADNQVRKLEDFNALMRRKKAEAEQVEGGTPEAYQTVPEIVIVIDELADLMMVAAKEVETSICRIAQKARAAGMYLIVATQRPSADVITGIMKANIPSRIAFAVASQIESRIILDQTGAEKLIGKGDMLYAPLGEGKAQRIQGCFISNDEIERVIEFVKGNGAAEYSEEILEHIEKQAQNEEGGGAGGEGSGEEDELLMEAIDVVINGGQASVSMLQRRLKLGYSRAARIVDQMEERGIVGPFEGSKPRQILISKEDWQEMKLRRQA